LGDKETGQNALLDAVKARVLKYTGITLSTKKEKHKVASEKEAA
jgi:hypothetical protein